MANFLTIDIGNSSAKAALWHDNELIGTTLQGKLNPIDIEHLCAMAQGQIACAAVCAVGPDDAGLQDCAQQLCPRTIVVNHDTPAPVDISDYAASLGSDRLAALCGARALFPRRNALVVDCGTAVTYDLLLADGKFAGGNIAPGIGLRLRALAEHTRKLPEVESRPPQRLWALDTPDALRAGAYYGVAAETDYYMSKVPRGTALLLTGGRGQDIAKLIRHKATYAPDLVLRGLKKIIDYNEKS